MRYFLAVLILSGLSLGQGNNQNNFGGPAPNNVVVTTGCGTAAHCAVASYPPQSLFYNQQATAGTAVFYDLPAVASTIVGMEYCFKNSDVAGTARTGAITVNPPTGAYIHVDGTRLVISHGVASIGAAGDSACFVAINIATQVDWEAYIYKGTWATN